MIDVPGLGALRGGYRASVAASLLARAGREVVLIDDDFGAASAAGLPMEEAEPPRPERGSPVTASA